MAVYLIILGLFGVIFGSFANAYIFRYISGDSVWRGRSACPHCKHELSSLDLIPLFSYLWLRGRCRYCKARVAWQYPAVEAFTGLVFVGVGLSGGPFHSSLSYLLPIAIYLYLAVVAVIVSVIDVRIQIIPDRVILPAMIVVALLHLAQVYLGETTLANCWVLLAAAFGAAGALWLLAEVSQRILHKETMGGGDIKLTFLIGLLVGWPGVLIALLISYWVGAIAGVFLLLFGGRKLADRIPFGPYLVLGALVALVWGSSLLHLFRSFVA